MTAAIGGRAETDSPPITPDSGIASSRLSSRPVSPSIWPVETVNLPDLDETYPVTTQSLVTQEPDSMFDERLREEIAIRKQQACPLLQRCKCLHNGRHQFYLVWSSLF